MMGILYFRFSRTRLKAASYLQKDPTEKNQLSHKELFFFSPAENNEKLQKLSALISILWKMEEESRETKPDGDSSEVGRLPPSWLHYGSIRVWASVTRGVIELRDIDLMSGLIVCVCELNSCRRDSFTAPWCINLEFYEAHLSDWDVSMGANFSQ